MTRQTIAAGGLMGRHLIGTILVVIVAACGSSAAPAQSTSPTAAPTSAATSAPSAQTTQVPTAGVPVAPQPTAAVIATPAPTAAAPQSIKALLAAPHPKVAAAAVVAAITTALAIDPTGGGFVSAIVVVGDKQPGVRATGKYQSGFVNWCQTPPTATKDADFYRQMYCQNIVGRLFKAYAKTGIPEFYEAALAVYNFAANVLPASNVAAMDTYLEEFTR
jgi:pyruvate/2-oxoglutarate dehydrogenase complex dihydrolipoamide acyltransferase (E2) component